MRKLVVAIDFSPASIAALAQARALGPVELVHVRRTAVGSKSAWARLEEIAAGDAHQVRTGRLADELLVVATMTGAAGIVLGAPAAARTVRQLVRRSPVPVLFARGDKPSRVVVAVDFSGPTRAAIPTAFEAAESRGLPLELLHVVDVAHGEHGGSAAAESVRSLAKLALERDDIGRASVSLREGDAAAALIAATGPQDLIVCGSNARTRFEEALLGGGVARRLVAGARGSVLVVGPSCEARPAERTTTLREIRAGACAGDALLVECARKGLIPLSECMRCGAFAGLIGEAQGRRVVRCREVSAPREASAIGS